MTRLNLGSVGTVLPGGVGVPDAKVLISSLDRRQQLFREEFWRKDGGNISVADRIDREVRHAGLSWQA